MVPQHRNRILCLTLVELQADEIPSPNVHTVKDVHAETFIKAYAAFLSKSGKVTAPANVDIIKTGRTS